MRADTGVGAMVDGFQIEVVITQSASGTLYRGRDNRDHRPVAMFVLAPELAEDHAVRSRFVRAAELATTLRHPHALPVESTGDTDDAAFLVNPWVDGVDLAARLAARGPLTPANTLRVLLPAARALAAAHRLGLAHGSLAAEHVLIADGADGKIYLGGFGIGQARRDAATMDGDLSAFGQLLLQTLGHGDRHRTVGADDGGLGDRIEVIAAGAQASGPDRPIGSADELVLALEHARAAARAALLEPDRRRIEDERIAAAAGTSPHDASERDDDPKPVAARARRTPQIAAVGGAVLGLALLVALGTYGGRHPSRAHAASRPRAAAAQPIATIAEGHLSVGQTIGLGAPADGVAVGPSGAVWASLPSRGEIVRLGPGGRIRSFSGIANGGAITATNGGAWIAQPAGDAIQLSPDGHVAAHVALPGQPVAVAADVDGSSAWVADTSGGIAHVGGASSETVTSHVSPAVTSLWVGEPNWVWAVNGSLVRVSPDGSGSETLNAGAGATAVTVNQGVWVAHGDGTVTRFDPRLGHVVATVRTPGHLSGIAAREGSPYVWAISSATRSLYEIGLAGPQVVGVVRFSSPPTGVAVTHLGVWVTTAGGSLIRIQR